MSNDTVQGNGTEIHTGYAFVFGSVSLLGLPLNAVALWILLRRHSLKSPSAVFMVNLAISDLLLVISLPTRAYFYATGMWPLGSIACICFTMLLRNNIRSSSIFITFISVDRLLAVVYPLRSRHLRSASHAWRAVVLVWLLVLALNVPESIVLSKHLNSNNETKCFALNRQQELQIFPLSYFWSVLVFIMLAVNIMCTALVSWTLHRRQSESAKIDNKVNVMLIFVMNLIMFTIFFLPLSLVSFFKKMDCILLLACVASVNCCLDPLLYYFSFDGFWKKKEDVQTGDFSFQ